MDIKPIHNQSPQPQLPPKLPTQPPTQQPALGQATKPAYSQPAQPPLSHTNKITKVTLRQSRLFTKLGQIVAPIHKLTTPLKPHTSKLTTKLSGYTTKLSQYFLLHPIVKYASMSLLVLLLSASVVTIRHYQHIHSYDLSSAEQSLLGKSTINPSKINQTTKDISFNLKSAEDTTAKPSTVTVASSTNASGNFPYQATLSKKASDGMSFGSAGTTSTSNSPIPGSSNTDASSDSDNSFKLIPQFSLSDGQLQPDGQVIYPGASGTHQVYTFKRNGVKQDILLTKPIGDSTSYTWKLDLPNSLQAKMMSNGGVGIYSANPVLSDPNLQVGDAKTQDMISKAKLSGVKDYLAYVIPAPYLLESAGSDSSSNDTNTKPQPNYADAKYSLNGFDLTLTVKNLKTKNYPLTIDPTVTVTTTADFQTAYYDDGMINYGTANQIGRSAVSIGTAGTWNYTDTSTNRGTTYSSGFINARSGHTSVAYNGYLYVIGGVSSTVSNDCTASGFCNGVQFAPINSNGTIGIWHYTHASTDDSTTFVAGFTQAREYHTSVAYNGYLYIMGGVGGTSANDCTATANVCIGVQFAPINSNGTIGTWAYTHTSTNDGTSFVAGFTRAHYQHTSVVYNGYLYVIGGITSVNGDDCTSSGNYCNGVQYAPINSNGTIGTWAYTDGSANRGTTFSAGFTQPRFSHSSVAYNGYLYVTGGKAAASANDCTATGNNCNGTQFALINSDGTIGTWNYTYNGSSCATWTSPCNTGFTQARAKHTSVANNGYLYVIGGISGTSANDCTAVGNDCNGTQYTPINSNGTIGTWTATTTFTKARYYQSSVAYNGYLYIVGGIADSTGNDCPVAECSGIQYAPINTGTPSYGLAGAWNYTAASSACATWVGPCNTGFTQARAGQASVAYNGYLYVIGGQSGASGNDCTMTTFYCNGTQFAPINSNGTIGAWNYTYNGNSCATWVNPCNTGFTQARGSPGAIAYNGYLYIVGGVSATSANDCTATSFYCNGVQYAAINSNGTIGTWHYTHASTDDSTTFVAGFTQPRTMHSTVVYNGYLYVLGGDSSSSANDCTATSNFCNGIQFAPINSNGTVGAWHYTHASTDDGTTFSAGFINARYEHTSVAYNGYLYIVGGNSAVSANDCVGTVCGGVQFAPINSNGTIGTWAYTHASTNDGGTYVSGFTNPRNNHTIVAYNGYLYVIGGIAQNSANDCTAAINLCTGVQFAPINSNGTIGTWAFTHASTNDGGTFVSGFTQARFFHSTVAYNGYVYVIGGASASSANDCTATNSDCTGVQFSSLNSPAQAAHYERILDGASQTTFYSLIYNGTAPCGIDVSYRTAGTAGTFGSSTSLPNLVPGQTYILSISNTRYVDLVVEFNDQSCGGTTSITDFTLQFGAPPTAPTLTVPSASATGVALTPIFRLNSTDLDNDYLQYEIQICTTSNCSSVVQTACQNSSLPNSCSGSQVGWSSQSLQSGTAYSSGQYAVYTYQGVLSPNTQYWWRAYAIDPGGVNTSTAASSIGTFTTLNPNTNHGVCIGGC